jgi:hypothetical protein
MLRIFSAPAAILGLLAIAHLPSALAKPYPVHIEGFGDLHNASQIIDKRQCAGPLCGWNKQLCCAAGQTCFTDANDQAQCAGGNTGGNWQYLTSTYVETAGVITHTTVYSSYIGGGAATPTGTCKDSQNPCNGKCCDSGFYCGIGNQCLALGGGTSGGIVPTVPGTLAPSAPLRPTNSGLVIVLESSSVSSSAYCSSSCSACSAAHAPSSTPSSPSSASARRRSTPTRKPRTLRSTTLEASRQAAAGLGTAPRGRRDLRARPARRRAASARLEVLRRRWADWRLCLV